MRAIVQGVNEGRRGLGNIYVWASGDGGLLETPFMNDNKNFFNRRRR